MNGAQRYVSDLLTHFVGRGLPEAEQYALLVRVLREGRLTPPPHDVDVEADVRIDPQEPLSGNRAYEPRVVCLTDVPEGDLHLHIRKYSAFGLGFSKTFAAERGANPVFYVAASSRSAQKTPRAAAYDAMARRLHDLRAEAQARARERDDPFVREFLELARFLDFEVLSFLKFFEQTLPDADPRNFYMEREWRLHGALRFEARDVRRVFFPEAYAERFRRDVPDYAGEVVFSRS